MGEYIIPAAAGIIVAIIEYFAARDRKAVKRQEEIAEAHAKVRAEEIQLSMRMHDTSLQLSIAAANALGCHNNSDVDRALAAARKAQDEYNDFLQRIASKEITK